MLVTRRELITLGVCFLAIGSFHVLARGDEPFKARPMITRRVAGGILCAIGCLCLLTSLVW